MIFSAFTYERPDIEALQTAMEAQLSTLEAAESAAAQNEAIAAINRLRKGFETMQNLCYVRHTINTQDAFYENENAFYDEHSPAMGKWVTRYYQALLDSPFRDEMEQKWGKHIFETAAMQVKAFKPEIVEDLQEENRLRTEYVKLQANIQVELDGQSYSLSQLTPFGQSPNRERRRQVAELKWNELEKYAPQFEEIFDKLVKVRHRMAQKLGFKNYVEMGYARLKRVDYGPEEVARFRKQILEEVVPLCSRLYERQAQRLGLEELRFYDEVLKFPKGNPQPQGEPEWIIEQASQMYAELSPETDDFFSQLRERELMDLLSKPAKAPGGYCIYLPAFNAPFIYSNFNGTLGDIDVLTHEAGHAFQLYCSSDVPLLDYVWPSYEACEIHSMSMEFFTRPWMQRFFGEQVEQYRFNHLASALAFLPYGAAVDEFQHFIYENPEVSPAERNAKWAALERQYLPHRNYEGLPFLQRGGLWQRQMHIFSVPFYYIDYALAQICALQFWQRDLENHEEAWADYLRLCAQGGRQSFLNLLEVANLQSPFEMGTVRKTVEAAQKELAATDDSKL